MSMEYRVYSIKLARFLTDKGFDIKRTAQDVKNPNFINWIFDNTEKLQAALLEYKRQQDAYFK